MITLDHFLLALGFLFTFFLPGFLIIETFFAYLPKIQKLPLYFLLSVLVSTWSVYFLSFLLGYSRTTILIVFVPFLVWLVFYLKGRRPLSLFSVFPFRQHWLILIMSLLIFLIFTISLYPAILSWHNGYFVLSAVNWQDGANHLAIIETFSQGNFPPQAPYFAGRMLIYYVFTDFHSSILETLFGRYWPRVLVYDNPFFVLTFALSLYALAFYVTRQKLASILTVILAVFQGNLLFVKFLGDVLSADKEGNLVSKALYFMANKGYTLEYNQLLQFAPMADYFLQNRPLMVGLPGAALGGLLVLSGFRENRPKNLFLAGLMAGLLIKFHIMATGVILLVFGLAFLFYPRPKEGKHFLFSFISFLLIISLFSQGQTQSLSYFFENLSFGIWDKTKDLWWYLAFYITNFDVLFIVPLAGFLLSRIGRLKLNSLLAPFFIWMLLLFLIPHLVRFTVTEGDMYKFFIFMVIPAAVISGWFLAKLARFPWGAVLVVLLVFINSATSVLTLSWSFLNKNFAYSYDDYRAGLWIRQNTPQRSVFVTDATVHSAVSEIGGRLRVLSYTLWPYSHGFNKGSDSVFTRLSDIQDVYQGQKIKAIAKKYRARYIFYGAEEKGNYPLAGVVFDNTPSLKLVYQSNSIRIYEVQ